MNKYLSLLYDRKIKEAESYRKSMVPCKLLKFVSLTDDVKMNNNKFTTLKKEQAWFSSVEMLNDPYEFKFMFIDEDKLKQHGYTNEIICKFNEFFSNNINQWSVLSLSAASIDCLPMWAYYTNNFRGFCIEYEVQRPDAIFAIAYEPKRIPIASIFANFFNEFKKMIDHGEETNPEVEFYSTILRCQLHSKHNSWKHENEFRILYPLIEKYGQNVNIKDVGLKTNRIIAGLNCATENKIILNEILNSLGCGNILESKISGKDYTVFSE
ncbi:MAG: DUF2971 domain-containing protein [Clostridia bacterium]|nr:DUF2971 domain-containing protein [Clostridia bacterium]